MKLVEVLQALVINVMINFTSCNMYIHKLYESAAEIDITNEVREIMGIVYE